MTELPPLSDLSARMARLRPVAQALRDPHFHVDIRPIDGAWSHAGLTAIMGGFNPAAHRHYAAATSLIGHWLAAPLRFRCPADREAELADDILRFAHDYLHSWAYRLICRLRADFRVRTPRSLAELEEQAFFLVLTESVAVVGLDYWYLSLGGLKRRCGTAFDMGPCTVHYRERNLAHYRRADPQLTVQVPTFFRRIVHLYNTGEFRGVSEDDLLDNRPLADWLVREILIAPRQRIVSRSWFAHLGGLPIADEALEANFAELAACHADLITEIGEWLWQKVRHGRNHFLPVAHDQGQWQARAGGPLDCRYVTLRHLGERRIDWEGGGIEGWNAYIDQVLAERRCPAEPEARADLKAALAEIRETFDHDRLSRLVARLPRIEGPDPAPLEALYIN